MHGAIAEAQLPLLLTLSTYIHVGNAGSSCREHGVLYCINSVPSVFSVVNNFSA
jgi:hypothetical protein